jgi:hypothetical protein
MSFDTETRTSQSHMTLKTESETGSEKSETEFDEPESIKEKSINTSEGSDKES